MDCVNVYSGNAGSWSLVERIPLAYGVGYGASITVDGLESDVTALTFPAAKPVAAAEEIPVDPAPEFEPEAETEEPVEDSD